MPRSVALSAHGDIAFTLVDYGSSAEGWLNVTLVAWSTATGTVLATVEEANEAAFVDTSPEADTGFVAARDGWLRAYGCTGPAP